MSGKSTAKRVKPPTFRDIAQMEGEPQQKSEMIGKRLEAIKTKYLGSESIWRIPHKDEVRDDTAFLFEALIHQLVEKQAMQQAIAQLQGALQQAQAQAQTKPIVLPGDPAFAAMLRGGR